MRVAAVQMTSTAEKPRNLETARRLIEAAAAEGASLVALPEMFNILGDVDTLRRGAEPLDGPTMDWARQIARDHRLWLLAGSFMERRAEDDRMYNTSCLVDPAGQLRHVYRKLHLFDCAVPGAAFQESKTVMPGQEVVVADLDGVALGMSICYDLRFPELFRMLTLRGARVVVLPSAFTERTGRDHWEVLLRARAIENQVFVLAVNQVGRSWIPCLGRSMIVDPWGLVLAQAPDRETFVVADLDFAAQDAIRAQLPCLRHRRPDAYDISPRENLAEEKPH